MRRPDLSRSTFRPFLGPGRPAQEEIACRRPARALTFQPYNDSGHPGRPGRPAPADVLAALRFRAVLCRSSQASRTPPIDCCHQRPRCCLPICGLAICGLAICLLMPRCRAMWARSNCARLNDCGAGRVDGRDIDPEGRVEGRGAGRDTGGEGPVCGRVVGLEAGGDGRVAGGAVGVTGRSVDGRVAGLPAGIVSFDHAPFSRVFQPSSTRWATLPSRSANTLLALSVAGRAILRSDIAARSALRLRFSGRL